MDEVTFTPEEMSLLLSLGDDAVFNRTAVLDEVRNGTLRMFATYEQRRSALVAHLPPPDLVEGEYGTIALNADAQARLAPHLASITILADNLKQRCEEDARDT